MRAVPVVHVSPALVLFAALFGVEAGSCGCPLSECGVGEELSLSICPRGEYGADRGTFRHHGRRKLCNMSHYLSLCG